jgi:hypothetical protein
MGRHRQPHHLDGHAHRHATGEDDTKTVPVRGPTTPSSRPCPRARRPLVSYRKVVGTGKEVQLQRDQVLDLAHRSERLRGRPAKRHRHVGVREHRDHGRDGRPPGVLQCPGPLASGRSRWWPRGNPAWSVTGYCPSAPSSPPSTCCAVRRTGRCPRNPRGQATPVGRQQPRHPSRPGEAHSRRPDETIASKPPNPRILALRFPRSSSVSPRLPADVLGRAS